MTSNSRQRFILIVCTLCALIFFRTYDANSQFKENENLFYKIIKSDSKHLIIEFTIPQFHVNLFKDENKEYQIISIPGYTQTSETGKPQLPYKSFLIGIPPNSTPNLEILEADFTTASNYTIPCSPEFVINPQSPEDIVSGHYSMRRSTLNIASQNHFYPGQAARIGKTCTIRNQLISAIQIFPIRYNHSTQKIQSYKRLKIKITFNQEHPQPEILSGKIETANPFEKVFKNSLINYSAVKNRIVTSTPQFSIKKTSVVLNESTYKIFVDCEGIYLITKNLLDDAGVNTAVLDPMKIQIFKNGIEIPIYIEGEEDHVFDDSDYIEFYGFVEKNDYTTTNIYWLICDGAAPGKRVRKIDGSLTGAHPVLLKTKTGIRFEKSFFYATGIPDGEGKDHWFWDYISGPKTVTFNANLNDIASVSDTDCSFKIAYRGFSFNTVDPDHHTVASLNGHQLLDDFWDGRNEFTNTTTFSPDYLVDGDNTVTIALPGDTEAAADALYFNWFEIEYWRNNTARNDSIIFKTEKNGLYQMKVNNFSNKEILVYDISNIPEIRKITNADIQQDGSTYTLIFEDSLKNMRRYFAATESRRRIPRIEKDVPSQLKSNLNQADYVIITHEDFYSGLSPLIQFRGNQGLNVMAIKITDIYDEFNYGIKNPGAIKDFLQFAFDNWQKPAPMYVLLVGDASFDYKDYMRTGHKDFVPTHLFESAYYNTETASDNWFVCVSGDDNLPDMLIGRLPVQSAAETEIVVNKILNYENLVPENSWHKNLLFFADDDDEYNDFEMFSDSLIKRQIPSEMNIEKIFLNHFSDSDSARNKVINNINQGCLIANYMGHGGLEFLAQENLLAVSDIPNLTNGEKQPFFLSLSCLNGFFHHPKIENCLSETFLKAENRGAIGCYSPSGFATPGVLLSLADEIYHSIFQDENYTLGLITAQSKLGIVKAGVPFLDHIDFYNLLGDPALRLKLEPANSIKPAGFYGTITINDEPAPMGTEVIAWIGNVTYSVHFEITEPGRFGIMQIPGDNPATQPIEGGVEGDTVRFKIVTIDRDSLLAAQTALWQAGIDQQIDLTATWLTSVRETPQLQVFINDKIFGKEFFDGDPVFKNSTIRVKVADNQNRIDIYKTQIILNGQTLEKRQYSIIPAENDPAYEYIISFQTNNLPDDIYNMTINVFESAIQKKIIATNFSFRLFSALTLERVLNYPNPMQRSTSFTYYLVNQDPAEVIIKIYTVAGRLIKVIHFAPGNIGYNQVYWDGRDEDSDELANGVYFYKISARSGDGSCEVIERLIVMK